MAQGVCAIAAYSKHRYAACRKGSPCIVLHGLWAQLLLDPAMLATTYVAAVSNRAQVRHPSHTSPVDRRSLWTGERTVV